MLVYLDSVIVIYAVEGHEPFRGRAAAHIAALRAAGHTLAISDLTWLECLVGPLRAGEDGRVETFDEFLSAADILRLSLATPVVQRATAIRARLSYSLADSLHLAAAIEAGCDRFLTNDARLAAVDGLEVEALA